MFSRLQIFNDVSFNRVINELNASASWLRRKRVAEKGTDGYRGRSTTGVSSGRGAPSTWLDNFLLSLGEHVASGMRAMLHIGILQRRQFSLLVFVVAAKRPLVNRSEGYRPRPARINPRYRISTNSILQQSRTEVRDHHFLCLSCLIFALV